MPLCVERRVFPLFLAAVVAVGAASATAAGRPLTLREAEQLALDRQPQLAIAKASVDSARAGVRKARATILPSASLSGGYTNNVELPVFVLPPPIGSRSIGETHNYQLALNAQQPLFLGFAGVTGLDLAKTNESSVALELEQTTQTVLTGVREAYLGAVLARSLVKVQEEAVAQAESSLALVQRRYDVGTASGFDLLRARVQLATVKPNLVTARSNRDLADAQLRLAIGLDPSESAEPADTLRAFVSMWADVPLDSLVEIAYARRPDVRQIAYVERIARDAVRLSRSAYYPMLFLVGRTQWQAQTPTVSVNTSDFVRSTSVGVQLNWTLWDSWKTPASVQAAKVGVRQVSYFRQLLRDGISVEVESAYHRLHEAAVNLASGEETVAQAAEALRLSRVMYAQGSSTQLDVINAQVSLTQARTQYAGALYEYHIAHTRMEKALGLIHHEG